MKVKIQKDIFLRLVSQVQGIVENRNVLPLLSKCLISAENGKLSLFATDNENSIQTFTKELEVIKSGDVLVNAKKLFEIIKELDSEEVVLEKSKNDWLKIKQEKSVFNIVGLKTEDFPVFPSLKLKKSFKISSKELLDLIEKTIFCVSTDETRYHLNGIYFESNDKNNLKLVSTDVHRMSFIEHNIKDLKEKNGRCNYS